MVLCLLILRNLFLGRRVSVLVRLLFGKFDFWVLVDDRVYFLNFEMVLICNRKCDGIVFYFI